MPHNLFDDQIAFAGLPAWHGLGTEVERGAGVEEMITAANLDWRVRKDPAPGAWRFPDSSEYDRYLVRRECEDPETEDPLLGVVGRDYTVLQNIEAFRFFEPFLERGWASFETAGALGRGERVWVLARLQDDIRIVEDDVVHRYLLLSNSHDGSSAVSVRFTCVRVVCQNTLILSSRGGKKTSEVLIPHTPSLTTRLASEQANKLKETAEQAFEGAWEHFGRMASRRVSERETEKYLERLFPRTDRQKQLGEYPLRWHRVFAVLDDDTVTPARTRDTVWGLYNAVVREEDFRETRGREPPDARLRRIWFGRGSRLKLKALTLAQTLFRPPALN